MCLYSKEVPLIPFTQPLVLSAAVRKIISQIHLLVVEKMPIWPGTHILMNKSLHKQMCQNFGAVRKLLRFLVGPPVSVLTGGAICERLPTAAVSFHPIGRCSAGPGTLQSAKTENCDGELDFWWRI